MSHHIEIADQQTALPVNTKRIKEVIRAIVADAQIIRAEISIAVVDDETIHQLNREYLEHDYPTDVLSFVLEHTELSLQGEVIVSSDTAITNSAKYDQSAENELFLYVVHGLLHLVGYDDKNAEARADMRLKEQYYLKQFKINHHIDF